MYFFGGVLPIRLNTMIINYQLLGRLSSTIKANGVNIGGMLLIANDYKLVVLIGYFRQKGLSDYNLLLL